MSRATNKFNTKLFLSVIISFLFLIYVYKNHQSLYTQLHNVKLSYLLFIMLFQVAAQWANSELFHTSVNSLGSNKLGHFESFRVTIISSFVNFFTPVVGGASTKAVYLKKKHGLNYSSFLSVLYANYLASFFISFTLGLIGLILSKNALHSHAGVTLLLFFISGAAACSLIIVFDRRVIQFFIRQNFKGKLSSKIGNKLILVIEGWEKIKRHPKTLIKMLMYTTFAAFCTIITYLFVMKSLGLVITVWTAMIFTALSNISLLFNITPGNIGIRETIYASTYAITNISGQQVVAFSLLERSMLIIVLGMGWIIFSSSVLYKNREIDTSV